MSKENQMMFYRIEYNEKQQGFHLEWHGKDHMALANTHGWHTVFEYANDDEFKVFKILLDTMTKGQSRIDLEDVLKCKSILVPFHTELINRGFNIIKTKK